MSRLVCSEWDVFVVYFALLKQSLLDCPRQMLTQNINFSLVLCCLWIGDEFTMILLNNGCSSFDIVGGLQVCQQLSLDVIIMTVLHAFV